MRPDGKPTNPRFTWPAEVRQLQREAADAIDRLVRAEIAAEVAAGKWDYHDEERPGTITDDYNESAITGFVAVVQYQYMVGDAEDSIVTVTSSGTLTESTQCGLVRNLSKRYD